MALPSVDVVTQSRDLPMLDQSSSATQELQLACSLPYKSNNGEKVCTSVSSCLETCLWRLYRVMHLGSCQLFDRRGRAPHWKIMNTDLYTQCQALTWHGMGAWHGMYHICAMRCDRWRCT